MAKVLYFILTFFESGLAVFGIRATFEEPPYKVTAHLADGVEVRTYAPSVVAQTAAGGDGFSRLFRYIAGANGRGETMAMTTPVEEHGGPLGRPAAEANDPAPIMRFFLPRKVAADPPVPKDAAVRVVRLPARTVAALRFSGSLDASSIATHAQRLRSVLAAAHRPTDGAVYVLGYDPPFTIPFLRRNEVAVDLAQPKN